MGILDSLIGGVGSLFGGALSSKAQDKAQKASIKEAQRAEAFAAARDDNKLQRLVADAKSAGVHPLAALGSSIAGSFASPVSPSFTANTAMGDAVGAAASSFANMIPDKGAQQTTQLQNDLLRAQIDKTKAESADILANATSRSLISKVRAAAIGGPGTTLTSANVDEPPSRRTFVTPGGSFTTSPSTPAQVWEDQYGDLVGGFVGAGNFLSDSWDDYKKRWFGAPVQGPPRPPAKSGRSYSRPAQSRAGGPIRG